MSVLHRTRNAPKPPVIGTPPSAVDELVTPLPTRVPRTRISGAWLGICVTVISFVVLIVFMLQNTGSVAVNFLWLNGSVPLALALFIAGVAGVAAAVLATSIGAARMTQLRRLVRRGKD
ncbi:lipopolysaccharide assembly protein LapA domain-containing protein [Kribbella solani]|uniref:lipopolysaccharide assembly protein LapA domain-containing protein n=1 Tax=Kribbella solani TaxID=236067 RepID=UPI0029AE34D0|nr:lipopolysaccharide assembly protein LapA domain-containing protein [Kribbella solani]MDX3003475.1 lipopolysaccharide assembly protein LapA domain-containing protein [Kribbella solani]